MQIVKIRKTQRKLENLKRKKALKARYKYKPKKNKIKIVVKKPTIYDDYIDKIIKNIY